MTVRQKIRLAMAMTVLVLVLWLLWRAGAALAPFAVGAVLAYVLGPLVQSMARLTSRGSGPQKPWARPVAILVIYLIIALLLSGLGLFLGPIVIGSIQDLIERRDELMQGFQQEMESLLAIYREKVPQELQTQIDAWVQDLLQQAGSLAGSIAQSTFSFTIQSFSVLLGFLVIPIWLFLFMKDQPRFSAWFYGLFPAHIRPDVRELVSGASSLLGRYIRAQLILSVSVGLVTYIGLALLGVPFSIPLAITAGFLELIPTIGPILAGIIAFLVVLATEPGWLLLWVVLLYIGVQQLENYVLVPRVQGSAMRVHPAMVITLIVIVGEVFGLLGMLVAVPGYALLRDTYLYVYRRLGEGDRHPARVMPEVKASEEPEPVPVEQGASPARGDQSGEPS